MSRLWGEFGNHKISGTQRVKPDLKMWLLRIWGGNGGHMWLVSRGKLSLCQVLCGGQERNEKCQG